LSTASYPLPVARLLGLGREPALRRVWPNYLHLGLQARHVPDLIRMATDVALLRAEQRDPAAWAPLHAWRALGLLEAVPAVAPLYALLEAWPGDAAMMSEIPVVLGMIGPAALPEATLWLFDETRLEPLRVAAGQVLAQAGYQHPDRRDEAVGVLVQQLRDWEIQSPDLNAFLIDNLLDLGAVDAAPLMEAAFAAGKVTLWVNGDWEDVQIDLGLLEERITPPPDDALDPDAAGFARTPRANAAARDKARRKAAKQSRKRNRKRK
jgi:hypothetical protein